VACTVNVINLRLESLLRFNLQLTFYISNLVKITGVIVLNMLTVQASAGNTKGGGITVPLTSCWTDLDKSVLQIKQKLSIVIQLIPNQSNTRSTVQ
jgi:hypothetical protein